MHGVFAFFPFPFLPSIFVSLLPSPRHQSVVHYDHFMRISFVYFPSSSSSSSSYYHSPFPIPKGGEHIHNLNQLFYDSSSFFISPLYRSCKVLFSPVDCLSSAPTNHIQNLPVPQALNTWASTKTTCLPRDLSIPKNPARSIP